MTDERARDLERDVARTGTVMDRAALLRARVRGGALPPERLELAAYLGHDAALAATGWSCRDAQGCDLMRDQPPMWCRACAWRDAPTGYWASALARFAREDCVRVGVAAARLTQAAGCSHRDPGRARSSFAGDAALCAACQADERAVTATEAWALCPCEGHLAAVRLPAAVGLSSWALACSHVVEGDLGAPGSPLISCLSDCAARSSADVTFRAELCESVAAWALA